MSPFLSLPEFVPVFSPLPCHTPCTGFLFCIVFFPFPHVALTHFLKLFSFLQLLHIFQYARYCIGWYVIPKYLQYSVLFLLWDVCFVMYWYGSFLHLLCLPCKILCYLIACLTWLTRIYEFLSTLSMVTVICFWLHLSSLLQSTLIFWAIIVHLYC